MFKNYFNIALRNLLRHKGYWALNMLGLALGLASCIFIVIYVLDELSYDDFHADSERIYRVTAELRREAQPPQHFASTPYPLKSVLEKDLPAVDRAVRLKQFSFFVEHQNNQFHEEKFVFTDSTFFDIFSFRLQQGSPQHVLAEPFSVVLTSETAVRYFGQEDPIGRTLTIEDTVQFKVTGVLASTQENSHLDFDFLASFETIRSMGIQGQYPWWSFNFFTYIKVKESVDIDAVAEQVLRVASPYVAEEEKKYGNQPHYFLQPVEEIYLHSNLQFDLAKHGSSTDVYLFSVIAFLVLVIACINFVNLSTARSMKRAKEVGMRKALGAQRKQLIRQFLFESTLLTGAAFIVAIVCVAITLPYFNALSEKTLSLKLITDWQLISGLLAVVLAVGLGAGGYPAFVLSAFEPTEGLKKGNTNAKGLTLRNALVIFQFAISAFLLIATSIVEDQLQYMKTEDLGFAKEQILVLPAQHGLAEQYEVMKAEFLRIPGVFSASASSSVPGKLLSRIVFLPEGAEENETQNIPTLTTDHDFVLTYEMTLSAGRSFSTQFTTDRTGGFIVNESAVTNLGWGSPDNAIGREITWGWPGKKGNVIGVVRDFHQFGLRESIEPILMHIQPGWFKFLSLRISRQNLAETLTQIELAWQNLIPNRPIDYFFLNESFDSQYRSEQREGRIFSTFSILAIFIAGLGLFSLVAFSTEQRTKEVAVRKVLGASTSNILILLSNYFMKLIIISFLIAIPVSFFIVEEWLNQFAYRTDVRISTFVISGIILVALSFLTLSYQTIKAAVANPVEGLRHE